MRLDINDTIQCNDAKDMQAVDNALLNLGYDTEYEYEKDGRRGFWIRIINNEGVKG